MHLKRSYLLDRLYFLTLLACDSLIVSIAILFAVKIRFGTMFSSTAPFTAMLGTWIFLVIAEILFMMVEDLYAIRTTVNKAMNIFRTIRMIITISICLIVVLFITHFPTDIFICSRLAVFFIMIIWLGITISARMLIVPRLFTRLLKLLRFRRIRLVVFGSEMMCNKVKSTLRKSPVYSYILDFSICSDHLPEDPDEKFTRCLEILEAENATELSIVFEEEDFDSIARFSLLTRRAGIPFSIYSRRFPELGYFDPWISVDGYGALSFFSREWTAVTKALWRISDIITAIAGIIVFLPVIAFTVPAIALTSKGGILYKQTRVGYEKKSFSFLKFRSMRINTKDNQSVHKKYFKKYVNGDAAEKSENGSVFKIVSSDSVTPIGRIIRKTSIDELPQILNVLKGEMSIVGPRPCIDYETEFYTTEWLQQRFTVKPGLTGIWQVYGRSRLGFKKSQFLDFIYVLSRTDGNNIRLILKTFPVMFFSKGGL